MRDYTPNTWTSRVTITELDPKLCHFLPPPACILSISIPLSPFFRHKDKKHVVSHVEGVSKLSFQCGSRGCIKMRTGGKAVQLCVTAV